MTPPQPAPSPPTRRHFHAPITIAGATLAVVLAAPAHPAPSADTADSISVVVWEAPGDDGDQGRAALYQLRYRAAPVAGTDTLTWWNAATPVPGMPAPGAQGATDSVLVRGLDPNLAYYFILKVGDEVPNWSGFSNVLLRPPLLDVWPPAAVQDLNVTR